MHRYANPCRRSCGYAYRRRRKTFAWIPFILAVICTVILICIMPVWLICLAAGLAVGVIITLLLYGR
ncbi:MAG: hypothetical protein IJO93_04175 [Clostridia bacterium]|nr:hypothetical protein [Clostridia bacterium]